jgi:hypothetical protein
MKRNCKTANLLSLIILLIFTPAVFANLPRITSVTMVPANPDFGDLVAVTLTYCHSVYQDADINIAFSTSATRLVPGSGGQVFVVSADGLDKKTTFPVNNRMGYNVYLNNTSLPGTCTTCDTSEVNGELVTRTFNVHVPERSDFPGCTITNLYLHVGMKDQLFQGDWVGLAGMCPTGTNVNSSITWQIPVFPADFSIHKRVEGVGQMQGDLVLFSIDYTYANGPHD